MNSIGWKEWFVAAAVIIGGASVHGQLLPVRGQVVEGRYRTVGNAETGTLAALTNLGEGEKIVTLKRSSAHENFDGSGQVLMYSSVIGGTVDNGFIYAAPGGASARLIAVDQSYANVKWFNAMGNGTTDDSQEILAAMNAMAARGGGKVLLPKGTYEHNFQAITVPSNITVEGQGSVIENAWWAVTGNDTTVENLVFRRTANTAINATDYQGIQPLAGLRNRISNLRFEYTGPTTCGNAIRITGASHAIIDKIYCGPNAGAMGVGNYGSDIQISNFESDHGQDDDAIAIKSTTDTITNFNSSRWNLSNIMIRGGAAGVTIGSECAEYVRDINITNLNCEDCNTLLQIRNGIDATPDIYLGGTIEDINLTGFVFRTTSLTSTHGAGNLIWIACRKNGTVKNIHVADGIIRARQKNGDAASSSILYLQSLDTAGFTNTIDQVSVRNVNFSDMKNGVIGTPATDGVAIHQGIRLEEVSPDAGQSNVSNITLENITCKHLRNGFMLKDIPTGASYSMTGLRLRGISLRNGSVDPTSGDNAIAFAVFDHAGIEEVSGIKVSGWTSESHLPGPINADRELLSGALPSGAPTKATPKWLKTEEITTDSDGSDFASASPLIVRYRIPTRRYVARYEFISKGFPSDATNNNVYIVRKDVSGVKSSVTVMGIQAYSAFTSEVAYHTANGLLSPVAVPFGAAAFPADANTAPFTGYDNVRGELSWFSEGDHLEIWRADNGFGQLENDLRLRIYYLEF